MKALLDEKDSFAVQRSKIFTQILEKTYKRMASSNDSAASSFKIIHFSWKKFFVRLDVDQRL